MRKEKTINSNKREVSLFILFIHPAQHQIAVTFFLRGSRDLSCLKCLCSMITYLCVLISTQCLENHRPVMPTL